MPTHINAYKAELAQAEVELSRAQSRVEELKRYIESVEGVPEAEPEQEPAVNDEQVEVKVTRRRSGKGKK